MDGDEMNLHVGSMIQIISDSACPTRISEMNDESLIQMNLGAGAGAGKMRH